MKTRLYFIVSVLLCCAACRHAVMPPAASNGRSAPLFTYVLDDGNDTDYLVALEVFSGQGAVACTAITTDWIGKGDHLTAGQIRSLRDAGWEIMSHTATHPHLTSLTEDRIDEELARSKTMLESLGVTVRNIVYPYNQNDELVRRVASKYYRSGRGGTYAVNYPDTDPYFLKSYSFKHDLEDMKRTIDQAYQHRAWLIVYQHEMDVKIAVTAREGKFIPGEQLHFSPSGAEGRYEAPAWFQYFGSMYVVPLSGTPQPGDSVRGMTSKAAARLDHYVYDDRAAVSELIRYVRTAHPDMRIVTIDQGLDILGMAKKNTN
ncbi:MAG TPA: polysaccharide deacetylase family protein [Nitrospirota bacterium]|nr:polysaccharide deacetylase family protein [Nitrospirota bacterium]